MGQRSDPAESTDDVENRALAGQQIPRIAAENRQDLARLDALAVSDALVPVDLCIEFFEHLVDQVDSCCHAVAPRDQGGRARDPRRDDCHGGQVDASVQVLANRQSQDLG